MKRRNAMDAGIPKVRSDRIKKLLPKRKKGLLRIVFSRAGLAALLILLQLGMIYSIFDLATDYYKWFSASISVFAVLMVFYLFASDMDAKAKLTWLLFITLVPVPGAILLLFTQKNIGHRAVKKRLADLTEETKHKLPQDESLLKDESLCASGSSALCRYLNQSGCFPIFENTEVKYFPLGEEKFSAVLGELRKAHRFIFLEYFIIDEGYMWGSILNILAEKAKQGVEVRVMYDGMCEISTLSADYPKRLARLGIKCKPFSPIYPFLSTHYNYRDHRKILVIDGKVGFTGGVNLADEYINRAYRYGHWKDTAIMLKGEAVQSFTLMFLQMWNLTERQPDWDEYLAQTVKRRCDGYVMPYCDSPLDGFKTGENVYLDIINRAKDYVHIMTPYLILDNELESALQFAAQRGVDVKLILPGIPDKKAVYALSKSHYRFLLGAGVKVYEYTPGFVHAKVFVSDREKAVVGTINLDYRSLYHHFECAAYIYGSDCVDDIERDFQHTIAKCRRVTFETIRRESIITKATGSVMRIAAPLM